MLLKLTDVRINGNGAAICSFPLADLDPAVLVPSLHVWARRIAVLGQSLGDHAVDAPLRFAYLTALGGRPARFLNGGGRACLPRRFALRRRQAQRPSPDMEAPPQDPGRTLRLDRILS